ncbi:lipase family protein [Corynebacterium sp. H127]|uniref:lipase family protein n=1 Tax=Corynebacterium sp. H127 TaxID=3133418 RepID=UPI0030B387D8
MSSRRPEKLRGYQFSDAALLAQVSAPLRRDFIRFLLRRRPVHRSIIDDVKVPHFGGSDRVFGMEPGTVTEVGALRFLGAGKNPRSSKRFEYVTTDSHGRQLTATGAMIRSTSPRSQGKRPVIGFAPSTQGVAQHCDPSHSSAIGFKVFNKKPRDVIAAYELPVMLAFLHRGCDVVFIDYPRDPDAAIQYYIDHIAAGHALYDALKASRSLGIHEDQPIGLWGFSQGGGAVGWCVENPALEVKAAVVGAPPSTLEEVMRHVDGSLVVGTLAYSVAGLMVETPELWEQLWPLFNEHGRAQILANITTCAGGTVFASGYEHTRNWTVDGRSFAEVVVELPAVAAALRRQELGHTSPKIPVRLWGSRHDDVIPVGQVRTLRDRWRAQGGEVSYTESRFVPLPGRTSLNHFLPYYLSVPQQMEWLLERLR